MDDEMSVQGSGKSQAVRQPEQLGYPLALKLPSGRSRMEAELSHLIFGSLPDTAKT